MDTTKLSKLPILQHFESNQIKESVDSFRKGEKGLFFFIKLALAGAIGYFSWIYVFPPIFQMIGRIAGISAGVILVVLLVMLAPVIFKALRRFTRFTHQMVIKHDPFGELEEQEDKIRQMKKNVQMATGKMKNIKAQSEQNAAESEQLAIQFQNSILTLQKKAKKLKTIMDDLDKELGVKAKGEDAYVNAHNELRKVTAEGQRIIHMMEQRKDFVQKYGSRAVVMKKIIHKLESVETSLDIKILDFGASIDILKNDYAFAKESREATDAAKSVLGITDAWEVEYAIDVVTSTIAQDIAITGGNIKDIDLLTATYAVDSDELYDKLDLIANNINTGLDNVPSAKSYTAVDYQLTQEDKIASGGFGEVF